MQTAILFIFAALAEIAGCFAVWAWWRLDRSALWLLPGAVALALFAFLLARVDSPAAGRSFAAYGGVYVVSSIVWLWLVEGTRPDRWDIAGAAVILCGSILIMAAPRGT